MSNIIVLGASGMLGSSLVPHLRRVGHKVSTVGRKKTSVVEVSINFKEKLSLEKCLSKLKPDFIINLISLTNVDLCESNPSEAYQANVAIVERISNWINGADHCHLIQISTDHVYNSGRLSVESDTDLTNIYSFSKYTGELVALRSPCTVLRTNFFGRSLCKGRSSFTDWIFSKMHLETKICLFDDVFFSPLSIKTLVKHIELVVAKPKRGVFNLGSRNGLSKYNFGCLFAEKLGYSSAVLLPTKIESANLLARRPSDMRMDSSKFIQAFNLAYMPTLEEEINSVIGDYSNEHR